jgi:tetratricopeptide (TPR) repeat protein
MASAAGLALGEIYLAVGERDRARELLGEAIAISVRHHDPQVLPLANSLLAEDELLHGAPEAAYRRLKPLQEKPGGNHPFESGFLPLLGWAALALGDEEQAEVWITEGVARTRAAHYQFPLANALRIAGILAVAWQHWQAAEAALDEALALARTMGAVYVEAKVLCAMGQMYAARGEGTLARERYLAAASICQQLGEVPYRQVIERGLRR